jgi:hypothetical protein
MRGQSIIQRTLAFTLLLIFIFSITPKQYLHDLVASHTDFYSDTHNGKATVSQAGLNCHTEDQVVSTPFIETSCHLQLAIVPVFLDDTPSFFSFFYAPPLTTKDSRGPPSKA